MTEPDGRGEARKAARRRQLFGRPVSSLKVPS